MRWVAGFAVAGRLFRPITSKRVRGTYSRGVGEKREKREKGKKGEKHAYSLQEILGV
jgi:hypothetical protein